MPRHGVLVGTFVREADGANLLLYSPHGWVDASFAVRNGRRDDFELLGHALMRTEALVPPEAFALRPGEHYSNL